MTPPRDKFVQDWFHEFGGLMFDAMTCGHRGKEASMLQTVLRAKLHEHIGRMYDQLTSPNRNGEQPAKSAQPAQPQRR